MKKKFGFILMLFLFVSSFAQKQTALQDDEKIKKGISFGLIPVIAYDEDTGYKYGGVVNLFHYGDGSNYPDYNHSLLLQWTKTTKGSGTALLNYDALELIPKTRVNLTIAYISEQALNFYGFNGYNAYYNNHFEVDDNPDYISRMYYRHARKLFTTSLDFQGNIKNEKLRWLVGFAYHNTKIATVDIAKINEGLEAERLLPETDLLYDKYVNWGIIPENQKRGGIVSFLKLGFVYNTRDNETNPNTGIWSEALLLSAPAFLGNNLPYTKLLLTHRQYLTLIHDKLNFAYRLSYQTKISGEIPFYMLAFTIDSKSTKNGLGGASNLRGILRNRVVGDGVAFGNFELRSKFFKSTIFKQNFYLGVSAFTDMGIVTSKYNYSIPNNNISQADIDKLDYDDESLHISSGLGIHLVFNYNFVVRADYGLSLRKDDGTKGLYIGINYLF